MRKYEFFFISPSWPLHVDGVWLCHESMQPYSSYQGGFSMKRSNYLIVPMLAGGVLLMWGLAMSSEGTHGPEDSLLTAKLSMEEAIATAKAKFPGKVLEAELENEHGQAVYEIEIASTTGVVTEIKVDAQSGELLDSEVEDQDEREKSEEKDKD